MQARKKNSAVLTAPIFRKLHDIQHHELIYYTDFCQNRTNMCTVRTERTYIHEKTTVFIVAIFMKITNILHIFSSLSDICYSESYPSRNKMWITGAKFHSRPYKKNASYWADFHENHYSAQHYYYTSFCTHRKNTAEGICGF